MKKLIRYSVNGETVERQVNYIPFRYVLAALISLCEVLAIIGIVAFLCWRIPFFYIAALLTEILCVAQIVASDDNPDYKVPWLVIVLTVPIAGFMLYFLFYSRKLQPKFMRRLRDLDDYRVIRDDSAVLESLAEIDPQEASTVRMLCQMGDTHVYSGTRTTYYPQGELLWEAMLADLAEAKRFIYLEFFIIEQGECWDSILAILREKVEQGVEVRVLYDDVGCMKTLPGNYARILREYGIHAASFSRLRGNADNEFNNRNHRKILVIDGRIGYTGGMNLADEYIGRVIRFGHWKDAGLRLEGEAVHELTHLFLYDFGISVRRLPSLQASPYPALPDPGESGYVVPFGDGPRPIYTKYIAKTVIMRMLSTAMRYVYITTPYLIIDSELCVALENAAARGVDVRIILPHVPDKKLIFMMSRSYYKRLIAAGISIYEYTPGFLHAKCYLADDEVALVGTVNMDYRSLVHHFENAVYMYRTPSIADIRADIFDTMEKSERIPAREGKRPLYERIFSALVRIFAPLM